jgi:hypothetical protein
MHGTQALRSDFNAFYPKDDPMLTEPQVDLIAAIGRIFYVLVFLILEAAYCGNPSTCKILRLWISWRENPDSVSLNDVLGDTDEFNRALRN